MHRLQPVAGVRQRAMHDGRERISEIALFQRLAQLHLVDLGRLRRNQSFSHGEGLNRDGAADKSANQRPDRVRQRHDRLRRPAPAAASPR